MSEPITIIIAAIGLLTLLCQWLAWWVQLPAILFLLLSGIILGPVTHILNPDQLFGPLLFPIVHISTAIILFEGSLTLNFKQVLELRSVIRNLLTLGVLLTFAFTFLICTQFLGMNIAVSALLASITSVTGPTVITPLLRTVRPNQTISDVLRWEGIMVDPIGAILAIVVMGTITYVYNQSDYWSVAIDLLVLISSGLGVGLTFGYSMGHVLRRHTLPDYLHNVAVLIWVIVGYACSNLLHDGSGLLTVTVMGITLANMRGLPVDEILGFKESLSILLISGLFILLSARTQFQNIRTILMPSLILLASLQFAVRPLVIFICTLGSKLSWQERILVGWIAPRGIIAAAIAALFSTNLMKLNIPQANILVPVTFIIIIGTVLFQSLTSGFLARRLNVQTPSANGFLIIGSNQLAIAIASRFIELGFRVILASSNWRDIQNARMANIDTYYGNPTSDHADRHLDLIGIGRCLALSENQQINHLACLRYAHELGKKNTFYLHAEEQQKVYKHATADRHLGQPLFGSNINYPQMSDVLKQGHSIKSTRLTQQFCFNEFKKNHPHQQPLFLVLPQGKIAPFTPDQPLTPKPNDHIISIYLPPNEQ